MAQQLNLKTLSTSKLTKKLVFMWLDGQVESPLYRPYLEELKSRLGIQ